MSEEHPTRILPCNHEICQACYGKWKQTCLHESKNFTCPNCRYVVEQNTDLWEDIDWDDVVQAHDSNDGWYSAGWQPAFEVPPFESMDEDEYNDAINEVDDEDVDDVGSDSSSSTGPRYYRDVPSEDDFLDFEDYPDSDSEDQE